VNRVLLAFLVAVNCIGCSVDDPETPTGKREWSVLQVVEFQNREKAMLSTEFQTISNYELMSVPSTAGKRIWIMLRSKAPPYYKQLPLGNDAIEKTAVDELVRQRRVSATVEEVLRSHQS
jgi:hypothetical protein